MPAGVFVVPARAEVQSGRGCGVLRAATRRRWGSGGVNRVERNAYWSYQRLRHFAFG
ncbi:hypothetical protein LV779_34280 [Streptomyces thinghirensis]|nr:hypothetical protein [Streptomyces thinghirensis]